VVDMRKIRVKNIKDGMILEESIKNSAGVILMGKGTVLREAFAPRLAQRGISTVCVDGEPSPDDLVEEHVTETQEVPLEALFERKIVNKTMKTIYEALMRHRDSGGT